MLDIALLAVLQGVTEFLPVSSSGHLVLGKHLLGLHPAAGPTLEVVLHGGTMVSIVTYYRRRLMELARACCRGNRDAWRFVGLLAAGCVPAVILYLAAGSFLEAQFHHPMVAAGLLCVTGCVVFSLRWAPRGTVAVGFRASLAMGIAQAVALLPGISRSGATLAAGRWCGLAPAAVAEMSFLMVLPLLGGAVLLEVPHLVRGSAATGLDPLALGLGFLLAAVTGYAALAALVRLLTGRRAHWFGAYCLAAGLLAVVLLAWG